MVKRIPTRRNSRRPEKEDKRIPIQVHIRKYKNKIR